MARHFIIMASAYSIGKRIVLDYSDTDKLDMDNIQRDIDYIFEKCGEDVPISTHFIQTNSVSWDSVIKLDNFFAKTELVHSKEKFVELIMKDRNLNSLDVAKYILTKVPCTHLKLEKLVYMCYADYLCDTKTKLFDDKIFAYKLGPVIKNVYQKYKKSGNSSISVEDDTIMYNESNKKMPIRSRILSSKDGIKKLISIDKTLDKYSNFSASYLVGLTHKDSTPWSISGSGNNSYEEITDDCIIKFHNIETI